MAERKKFLPKDVVVQKGPNRGRIAPIDLAYIAALAEDEARSKLREPSTELIEEFKKELRAEMSEEEIVAADEERGEWGVEWLRDISDLALQIELERRARKAIKKAIKKAGLKNTKNFEDVITEIVSDDVIREHRKQTKKRKRKEAASDLEDNNPD